MSVGISVDFFSYVERTPLPPVTSWQWRVDMFLSPALQRPKNTDRLDYSLASKLSVNLTSFYLELLSAAFVLTIHFVFVSVTGWDNGGMSHNMAMKRKLDLPPWSFEQHVPQSPDHTTSNEPAGPLRFGYEPRATSPYLADMAPSVHSVPPGLYATEFAKTREFKKKRRFCSRTRWLLFFLILFILLSSVLFGIVLWSWKPCSEDKETPTAAKV